MKLPAVAIIGLDPELESLPALPTSDTVLVYNSSVIRFSSEFFILATSRAD